MIRGSSPSSLRAVVIVSLLLLTPTTLLRIACWGRTCAALPAERPPLPFCSLPEKTRALLEAGFNEGRSGDILAVAATPIAGGPPGEPDAAWPSLASDTKVPIVVSGPGIQPGTRIPDGTGLSQVAPTIATSLRYWRPHPNVRSGKPIPAVRTSRIPTLVLEIALKGIGRDELEDARGAWPNLANLMREGAGTLRAVTGSLPLDPAAILTTIGTGGIPSEHGITGTLIRADTGAVVQAWARHAPPSIITTLPEDLDRRFGERPLVGLVATARSDLGLTGGSWYLQHDRDPFVVARTPTDAVRGVEDLLRRGFGDDRLPDVLAVAMAGPLPSLDSAVGRIVSFARATNPADLLIVVVGTGSAAAPGSLEGSTIADRIGPIAPVVAAAAPGGVFIDQTGLERSGTTSADVADAIREIDGGSGGSVMADVFPSYAVSFARYC